MARVMTRDFQIGFKVKGLIAPEKEIVFNNHLLIRRIPSSDDAHVFFKVTIQNHKEIEKEINKLAMDCENTLRNIVQIYGLVTRLHAEVLPTQYVAAISPLRAFGQAFTPDVRVVRRLKEVSRKKIIPLLEKTIEKHDSVQKIFENRSKSYLRNAISYFHHALGGNRYEEKLIDLMIALESLFSKEVQELRLRLSLRAAFLLSIGEEDKRSEIFTTVSDLYNKRSRIVHGTERVDLSYEEISRLESYVQESIKRLIHVEQRKDRFLELLDQAVYDENKRQELRELVSNSLSHWET